MSESITVREDKETVFDSALRFPCKCAPETLPEPARLRRCVEHCSAHVLTARAETTRGCLHVQPVKSEICSTARGRGPFFGKRAARLVPTPLPNHKTANPASHVIPMRTVRRSDHVIPPPDSPRRGRNDNSLKRIHGENTVSTTFPHPSGEYSHRSMCFRASMFSAYRPGETPAGSPTSISTSLIFIRSGRMLLM